MSNLGVCSVEPGAPVAGSLASAASVASVGGAGAVSSVAVAAGVSLFRDFLPMVLPRVGGRAALAVGGAQGADALLESATQQAMQRKPVSSKGKATRVQICHHHAPRPLARRE